MFIPFHRNGGPFLKAWIKAKYDDVWYTAVIDHLGRLRPDNHPPWPRPDLIQFAGAGVQASRTVNPMCAGIHDPVVPPCYAEMVFPIVVLDRLAAEGPHLRRLYFWIPTGQVAADENGYPSRLRLGRVCDTDRLCDRGANCRGDTSARFPSGRPLYLSFDGCGAAAQRVDTCYAAFAGKQ